MTCLSNLPDDPPPRDIHARKLDLHAVADQHPDEVPVDAIRDVGDNLAALVQPHAIQRARQLLHNRSGYRRTVAGTSRAVRIHGSPAVTATVCSKCAVQPSASTFTVGLPAFTIGSIASTMPSVSRGPRPGSP